MTPHFIYSSNNYYLNYEKFLEMFRAKMEEYGIPSLVLTTLAMFRRYIISKETHKEAYAGKLKNNLRWEDYEGSVNEDLESFLEHLTNKEAKEEMVKTFFTPKLTEEELELVAANDLEHLKTYYSYGEHVTLTPDDEEMNRSDSKDRFVHARCVRKTIVLTLDADLSPESTPDYRYHGRRKTSWYQSITDSPWSEFQIVSNPKCCCCSIS